MPTEECRDCGQQVQLSDLEEFWRDGHPVELCLFCREFQNPKTALSRDLAALGHILLKAIKDNAATSVSEQPSETES